MHVSLIDRILSLEPGRELRAAKNLSYREEFLGDHFDVFEGRLDGDERTLCGHIEASPRGMGTWQPPYAPAGAVQNKVADAESAEKMSLTAALGHACGRNFKAAAHLVNDRLRLNFMGPMRFPEQL